MATPAERHSVRCSLCGRWIKLLRNGTFAKHTELKNPRSVMCRMSNRRPPGPEAAEKLLTALRAAFWDYFGMSSGEWGPDRDEESAADAALAAVRTVNMLVVDGQVYLVASSYEVSETAGERQWTVTTNDEGAAYDVDG